MDFVSETGTYHVDWLSQTEDWLKGEDKDAWEGKSGEFRKKLDSLLKGGDVDPDQVCRQCALSLTGQAYSIHFFSFKANQSA